jgi:hypothetical protein
MLVVADEKTPVKYSTVKLSALNLASHRKHGFVIIMDLELFFPLTA